MYRKIVPVIISSLLFTQIETFKIKIESLVLTTAAETEATTEAITESIDGFIRDGSDSGPKISKFHVTSNIQFRYAHTEVVSYVKNPSSKAEEISFTAVIPDSAFISNFSMVLQGKEYVAQVRAKEEAKQVYDEAVLTGRGGGLVSQDARDANKFTVAANVEAGQKVEFKLTYEELLERKLGKYEHAINVNPGQIVEDLRIEVFINESLPIKNLFVPELKESNDIDFEENQESRIAEVERNVDGEASNANIIFAPDELYQLEAGEQGLSGQFLVQYDVDRSGRDNEVQVIDGYFVHYFTPENLPTLPKHVIFVLDVSGSMSGEKINQLKDAMFTILDDMTDKDFFNIITFSTGVSQWDPKTGNSTILVEGSSYNYRETTVAPIDNEDQEENFVIEATDKNKENAINQIITFTADGGTNINSGLLEGLKIAQFAQENEALPKDMQSIIVFLSDGQATEGVTNSDEIKENVKKANELNVPIYSLGFGGDADFNLIKDISASADAFAKQIYEGSDAAIQLENFFAEISSPLLSNIKFEYVGGLVDNSSVSDPQIRTFFKGGEFIVAGKLLDLPQNDSDEVLDVTVTADGKDGEQFLSSLQICLRPGPIIDIFHPNSSTSNDTFDDILDFPCIFPSLQSPRSEAQNFLQKLHAFINIKQLLKKNDEDELDIHDTDVFNKETTDEEIPFGEYENKDKEGNSTMDEENLDELEEIKEESFKDKALRLALENNFVTELTSLVVVRPDEEPKITNLVSDQHDFYDYGGFGAVSLHSGFSLNSFKAYAPVANRQPYPVSTPISAISYDAYPQVAADYSYSGYDEEDDFYNDYFEDNAVNTTTNSTETILEEEQAPCSGNITIFSKTYLRGENVTYSEDSEDLADFDNKLVSVEVEGNCCWTVFNEVGYEGISEYFPEGKYTSLVQVGDVFRKASSLRRGFCI